MIIRASQIRIFDTTIKSMFCEKLYKFIDDNLRNSNFFIKDYTKDYIDDIVNIAINKNLDNQALITKFVVLYILIENKFITSITLEDLSEALDETDDINTFFESIDFE